MGSLHCSMELAHLLPKPRGWEPEAPLREAVRSRAALLLDDRDPTKAWTVSACDLGFALSLGVLQDGAVRSQRANVTCAAVIAWIYARAQLGLPSVLRRTGESATSPTTCWVELVMSTQTNVRSSARSRGMCAYGESLTTLDPV